ncbi:BlaI/MecI/CopY family transcriptional regulator [Dethiobacter alkaliphilus]|uniref:Transcriptional repressor, CopY family n=1 Tax=Dethiobacter alkaliphilus AHT 1 TaxID=555088 RepID=C0GHR2_DETAL|nr:BlaI/MecI/CopY family transcriptional regulator [Dethiobacter alkaliphilus]EEG77268.1 transcriptional repressor, CopY family [Dethiobacter alkaliphilus AHT 1]
MNSVPRISEAEWQVMKVLWEGSPRTAGEIVQALEDSTEWNPRTIKTLVSRLVKKKAISYEKDEKDSRKYHYYPLVSEDECVRAESKSFLKRVYGGALNVMIANFLEEQELSQKEIEELKSILEKKEN